MHTLKSIAQRGTLFGAVAALVLAAVLPAVPASADALNPLTKRSLLLSSSAPGFQDTDGSGNSVQSPFVNPKPGGVDNYAPPGSGPNGKKTGETFTFNVSTDSAATTTPIKALTFQYCTTAAGLCRAPGNNVAPGTDTASTSDLNVAYTSAVQGDATTDDFQVYVGGVASTATDWVLATSSVESASYSGDPTGIDNTGKMNYITLTSATGVSPVFDEEVKVVFRASDTNYITNPGAGSFFVKINTYNSDTAVTEGNIIDGGVTVANVMTDSIHITTKVLETMSFSVGTQNLDTVVVKCATVTPNIPEGCIDENAVHGTCDPIRQLNGNRLQLGDVNAEYSLSTQQAYDVNSYWRLSSNSSGGATVYYSGNTLANTVGDEIAEIGATKTTNAVGTEQFGLGFVDAGADTLDPAMTTLIGTGGRFKVPTAAPFTTLSTDPADTPAQTASNEYNEATGTLATGSTPGTAKFAFQKSSLTVPVPIAQQNTSVIACATAKMRYVANIGADTPAGVYTTKINYLAAPQY